KHDKEHGYYEVNEKEARVVRKIFRWIATEGLTIRKVVRRLQESGAKPRMGRRAVWSTSTICHLLRNETYVGDAHYGKTFSVVPEHPLKIEKYRKDKKSSTRRKPRSEWIKIPVPSIIDRDLFDLAQNKLKKNFELSKRNQKYSYLLTGKIWCACGYRCNGHVHEGGKRVYYRCTQQQHTYPLPSTCHEKEINGKVAEKLVWEKLVSLMSSPRLLSEQIKRFVERQHGKGSESTADIEAMKQEISGLKEEESRYTKAYGAGLFSIEQLAEYASPVKERIASLNEQIMKAESERKEESGVTLPYPHDVEAFAKAAAQKLHDLDFVTKQAILRNVVDKIVGSHDELHVYGFIPVASSAGPSLCSSHRYGVNTKGYDVKGVPFEQNVRIPGHVRKMAASKSA
ncbi:MAG: recombinase family protein, partial [Thaumarchaeota archaeon]|nr:recombinase family protein [Nitrososphaerota archaeon]